MNKLNDSLKEAGYVHTIQGSDAWKSGRYKTCGGSEVHDMLLNFNNFISNKFCKNPEFDGANLRRLLQHGNITEQVINKHFETRFDAKLFEYGSMKGIHDCQTYSPDGVYYDEKTDKYFLCEFKSPLMRPLYKNKDVIKPNYILQMFLGIVTLKRYGIQADAEFFECNCIFSKVTDRTNKKWVVPKDIKYIKGVSIDTVKYYLIEVKDTNNLLDGRIKKLKNGTIVPKVLLEDDGGLENNFDNEDVQEEENYDADIAIDMLDLFENNIDSLYDFLAENRVNNIEMIVGDLNDDTFLYDKDKIIMCIKVGGENNIKLPYNFFSNYIEGFEDSVKNYCETLKPLNEILRKNDHNYKYEDINELIKKNTMKISSQDYLDEKSCNQDCQAIKLIKSVCNLDIKCNFKSIENSLSALKKI